MRRDTVVADPHPSAPQPVRCGGQEVGLAPAAPLPPRRLLLWNTAQAAGIARCGCTPQGLQTRNAAATARMLTAQQGEGSPCHAPRRRHFHGRPTQAKLASACVPRLPGCKYGLHRHPPPHEPRDQPETAESGPAAPAEPAGLQRNGRAQQPWQLQVARHGLASCAAAADAVPALLALQAAGLAPHPTGARLPPPAAARLLSRQQSSGSSRVQLAPHKTASRSKRRRQ